MKGNAGRVEIGQGLFNRRVVYLPRMNVVLNSIPCGNRSANALREEENAVVSGPVDGGKLFLCGRKRGLHSLFDFFGVTSQTCRQSRILHREQVAAACACKFGAVIQQRFVDMVADAGEQHGKLVAHR